MRLIALCMHNAQCINIQRRLSQQFLVCVRCANKWINNRKRKKRLLKEKKFFDLTDALKSELCACKYLKLDYQNKTSQHRSSISLALRQLHNNLMNLSYFIFWFCFAIFSVYFIFDVYERRWMHQTFKPIEIFALVY